MVIARISCHIGTTVNIQIVLNTQMPIAVIIVGITVLPMPRNEPLTISMGTNSQ